MEEWCDNMGSTCDCSCSHLYWVRREGRDQIHTEHRWVCQSRTTSSPVSKSTTDPRQADPSHEHATDRHANIFTQHSWMSSPTLSLGPASRHVLTCSLPSSLSVSCTSASCRLLQTSPMTWAQGAGLANCITSLYTNIYNTVLLCYCCL